MPFQLPDAPTDSMDVLRAGLASVAKSAARAEALGGSRSFEAPSAPHPVFVLALEGVTRREIGMARQVAWRYLLGAEGHAQQAAEIAPTDLGGLQFLGVTRGPFVESTDAAIAAAAERLGPDSASFELRLLRVPALQVNALWLVAKAGGTRNWMMPLAPAPEPLVARKLVEESAFMQVLYEMAVGRRRGKGVWTPP